MALLAWRSRLGGRTSTSYAAQISGWLLAFRLSFDGLVIASFVSGPGATTPPMWVYSSVCVGVSPEVNALAAIIVLVVSLPVIAPGLYQLKGQDLQSPAPKG